MNHLSNNVTMFYSVSKENCQHGCNHYKVRRVTLLTLLTITEKSKPALPEKHLETPCRWHHLHKHCQVFQNP